MLQCNHLQTHALIDECNHCISTTTGKPDWNSPTCKRCLDEYTKDRPRLCKLTNEACAIKNCPTYEE